jgi:hypothetical protein
VKITIDRSKWGPSLLLNPDNGDMCCLGQAAEQCGADREILSGRAQTSADDLKLDQRMELPASADLQRVFGNLCYPDGGRSSWKLKSFLAYLNDAYHRERNPTLRESIKSAIVQGFSEAGYEVEFQ